MDLTFRSRSIRTRSSREGGATESVGYRSPSPVLEGQDDFVPRLVLSRMEIEREWIKGRQFDALGLMARAKGTGRKRRRA